MSELQSAPQEGAESHLPEGIEKIERYAVEVPQLTLPSGTAGKAPLPEGLFPMSVGCALVFSSARTDGTLLFYGLTDRGPTLPAPSVRDEKGRLAPARYFLSPMFQPRIVRIEVTPAKARCFSPIALANAEAKPFSGLPARADDASGSAQKPFVMLSLANEALSGGLRPIDPEGLAIDPDADAFWVADRYGPSLRQFSRQGVERTVLIPGEGLPDFLGRRPGSSLRALARLADGRLVTFERNALGLTRFLAVLAVDPAKKASETYLWPVEPDVWKRGTRPRIGDAAALPDGRLLVIEQGEARDGSRRIQLVVADLVGAADFSATPPEELRRAKRTRPGVVKRRTILDLAECGWTAKFAKGLAVLPDGKTVALISDNRYGAEIRAENPDAPLAEPGDYVLESDGELTLAGRRSGAKLIVSRRSPQEARTDLFLITFEKPLVEL